jgi:hypothetical protein
MPDRLFRNGIHGYQQQCKDAAVALLGKLSDADLLNPNLAGRLDRLADQAVFEVAVIDGGEWGKPRTESSMRSDYGRQVPVEVEMMDMHIPFQGDRRSFQIQPSTSKIIDTLADVMGQELIVSFVYDDDLQRQLGIFLGKVQENLAELRKEMPAVRAGIRTDLGNIADQRIATMKAQQEKDKQLSFPVKRD